MGGPGPVVGSVRAAPLLVALGLGSGCVASGTVQPLVDARAAALATDASRSSRLALGATALVAEVCSVDLVEWERLNRQPLQISPSIKDLLGLDPDGVVAYTNSNGAVEVSWPGVELSPGIVGDVILDVRRPEESFSVSFRQIGEEPPGLVGTVSVSTRRCGWDPHVNVDATFSLDDGTDERVNLPATAQSAIWPAEGGLMPMQATFRWRDVGSGSQRTFTSFDVIEADGLVWPGVAEASDWSVRAPVNLTRVEPLTDSAAP
jgi:hypothetical protein